MNKGANACLYTEAGKATVSVSLNSKAKYEDVSKENSRMIF